ncbi:MAG: hypothetical protein MHM6MM_007628, partial [Cercozoa sp. M6MM]
MTPLRWSGLDSSDSDSEGEDAEVEKTLQTTQRSKQVKVRVPAPSTPQTSNKCKSSKTRETASQCQGEFEAVTGSAGQPKCCSCFSLAVPTKALLGPHCTKAGYAVRKSSTRLLTDFACQIRPECESVVTQTEAKFTSTVRDRAVQTDTESELAVPVIEARARTDLKKPRKVELKESFGVTNFPSFFHVSADSSRSRSPSGHEHMRSSIAPRKFRTAQRDSCERRQTTAGKRVSRRLNRNRGDSDIFRRTTEEFRMVQNRVENL